MMGVIMRLWQKAKGLFLTSVQTVTPQSQTAVLSRTDPTTGAKRPIYARPEIRPETGLPSERFDPRQMVRALGQSGQTAGSKNIYETPPTRPVDRLGFGYKTDLQ
jgi:hypothetical protein